MKNILLIFIILPISLFCQNKMADVFPSGGGARQNANYKNFGTMGQPLTSIRVNGFKKNKEGFIYSSATVHPILQTSPITNITDSSANSGGNIIMNGNFTISECGIIISETPSFNINDIGVIVILQNPNINVGLFSLTINSLNQNTHYYVKAFARNESGYGYGNELDFYTATSIDLNPLISISPTNAITSYSIADNGSNITSHGICYSSSENIPDLSDNFTDEIINGDFGVFTSELDNLNADTKYYARAYAINEHGISYSEVFYFYTTPDIQANRIVCAGVDKYQLKMAWTNGNGDRRVVICKESTPVGNNSLSNLTSYTPSIYYGNGSQVGGGYVVYDGASNNVTVKSLKKGTLYSFRVCEYNGTTNDQNWVIKAYNQSDAYFNPAHKKTNLSKETISDFTDLSINSLSMNPNPAKENLILKMNFQNETEINIQIFDLQGNLVLSPYSSYHVFAGELSLELDISKLYSGTYNLLITSGGNLIFDTFNVVR